MTIAMQTPEILVLLNNVIVNIITFIEFFGVPIFAFCMFLFLAWLIVQLGDLIKELIIKIGNQ